MVAFPDGRDLMDFGRQALRDNDAGIPTGCTPPNRGLDRVCIEPSLGYQPRDDGVRVPHLACP